jgi:hypothetical protein
VIAYDYTVAGTTYRSRRVFFGDAVALLWDETRRQKLASYPVGRAVAVAYDPAAPQDAVLEPRPNRATYIELLVPIGLAIWGLLELVGVM